MSTKLYKQMLEFIEDTKNKINSFEHPKVFYCDEEIENFIKEMRENLDIFKSNIDYIVEKD